MAAQNATPFVLMSQDKTFFARIDRLIDGRQFALETDDVQEARRFASVSEAALCYRDMYNASVLCAPLFNRAVRV